MVNNSSDGSNECLKEAYSMSELFEATAGRAGPIIFIIIMTILSFVTLFIYLEAVYYIDKKINNSRRKVRILIVLGLYPFLSVCSLLSLYMPKSHLITFLTGTVYLSLALFQFMMLIVGFYGGKQALLERLKDERISLSGPPLTCCCPCLPSLPMTASNLRLIRRLVLQVTFIRPIILFLGAVLWADGIYIPGNLKLNTINLYIQLISIGSTLVAVWGLIMVMRISSGPLREFNVTPKFLLIQLCLIVVSTEAILVPILAAAGAIPCTDLFPAGDRGNYIIDIMIVCEMFLFVVFGRIYYRTRNGNLGTLLEDMDTAFHNVDIEEGSLSDTTTMKAKEFEANGKVTNNNGYAVDADDVIDTKPKASELRIEIEGLPEGDSFVVTGTGNV